MNTRTTSTYRWLTWMSILCVLLIAGISLAVYGVCQYRITRQFRNPIAYTMIGGSLYVVERRHNTLLELDYLSPDEPLLMKGEFEIEKDDHEYYYTVSKLYPGPNGVVVKSEIHARKTEQLIGHRFREYRSFTEPPRELFTIRFEYPDSFPTIEYSFDKAGRHYFVNNCIGQRHIWKVPAEGGAVMADGVVPPELQQLGETNSGLSSWMGIHVDDAGRIFVSSGATGQVMEYSAAGVLVREIGEVGFEEGMLLAPTDLFDVSIMRGEDTHVTVASTGNRSWVELDSEGKPLKVVSPLKHGYPFPDVFVGRVYKDAGGDVCSFDLIHRAYVIHGREFKTITAYTACQPAKASLLLVGAALLVLLVVVCHRHRSWLESLRFPLFFKLLLLFVPLLVVSTLVVADLVSDIMSADLETESVRRSANLAGAIIGSIPVATLEEIRGPTDRGGKAYEEVWSIVGRILDFKKVEHTPNWVIYKVHEDRLYYGINNWRGPIYEPFIVEKDRKTVFSKVMKNKSPRYGRYQNGEGEWFSYVSPILNEKGEVIYVLELYRSVEEIERSSRTAMDQVAKIVSATVLVAVLFVLLFSYISTKPLRRLMEGTGRVSKGDFESRIVVHSRDEMGSLAESFNRMVVDLKRYTEDLARTTAEKERMQSELRLARELQQTILPKIFPPFAKAREIEIYAHVQPAREVGGDFYDFFLVDEDHMGAVIADISDKGVHAGLFMMVLRFLLRNNAQKNLSAADALTRLNGLIVPENPSNMFATIFYLVCNMKTGRVTYCNAGHNPPFLIRNGETELLEADGDGGYGTVVGVFEQAAYTDGELTLGVGDSLVLYTDGLTDATSTDEEMFGEDRVRAFIQAHAHLSGKEICESIFEEVSRYQAGMKQFDDITFLLLRFIGK